MNRIWIQKLVKLATATAQNGMLLTPAVESERRPSEERAVQKEEDFTCYDYSNARFVKGGDFWELNRLLKMFNLTVEYSELHREGTFPIAVEPLSENEIGLGLAKNGIVKLARKELVLLVWKFWEIVGKELRKDSEEGDRPIKEMQELLEEDGEIALLECLHKHPSLTGKLRVLEKRADAIPEAALQIPARRIPNGLYDKGLSLKVLALENCNRGCAHCGMSAAPNLQGFEYSDIKKWTKALPLNGEVVLSFGEPFYWEGEHAGKKKNVGDVVKLLLSLDGDAGVSIITSGINFASRRERSAAKKIASLSEEEKARVKIALSVSNHPHFNIDGMGWVQAAIKVQEDTARFAFENGLRISFVDFIDPKYVLENIALRAVEELVPGYGEMRVIVNNRRFKGEYRSTNKVGRAASSENNRRGYFYPGMDDCLISGNPLPVALFGDGSIGPGCCAFLSAYPVIANVGEAREIAKIEAKVLELRERLLEARDLALKSGDRHFDCVDCVAVADKVRHFKRFQRSIDKGSFAHFQKLKGERTATTRIL